MGCAGSTHDLGLMRREIKYAEGISGMGRNIDRMRDRMKLYTDREKGEEDSVI